MSDEHLIDALKQRDNISNQIKNLTKEKDKISKNIKNWMINNNFNNLQIKDENNKCTWYLNVKKYKRSKVKNIDILIEKLKPDEKLFIEEIEVEELRINKK